MSRMHNLLGVTAAVGGLLLGTSMMSSSAQAGPCPALGNIDAGCNVTITFDSTGTGTVVIDNLTPYDGSEDNLVGIVNNTGHTITAITINGSGIGGFDRDGGWAPGGGCVVSGPNTFGCFTPSISGDPGDYSGPDNTFGPFSASQVTVTFNTPLANGGTTFFTLEEPPSTGLTAVVSSVPEPASLAILGAALAGFGFMRRRRRTV